MSFKLRLFHFCNELVSRRCCGNVEFSNTSVISAHKKSGTVIRPEHCERTRPTGDVFHSQFAFSSGNIPHFRGPIAIGREKRARAVQLHPEEAFSMPYRT